MGNALKMCCIEPAYLDYLRQFDRKVSFDTTHNRKFIGVLFELEGQSYYAPLSSPKPRHKSISAQAPDIYKIKDGTLGVINLNNMIPVIHSAIISFDISEVQNIQYQTLLKKQMLEIRVNEDLIRKKALRLYKIVASGKQSKLNTRCCDFILLEQMSAKFGIVSPVTKQEIAITAEDED